MTLEQARELAAQAWCEPDLAEVFAQILMRVSKDHEDTVVAWRSARDLAFRYEQALNHIAGEIGVGGLKSSAAKIALRTLDRVNQ